MARRGNFFLPGTSIPSHQKWQRQTTAEEKTKSLKPSVFLEGEI